MLAVKLHRKERPWLGRGSYLVPIFNWDIGYVQVRKWIRVLNNENRNCPNHHIRYMTQVRIPGEHVVALHEDWIENIFPRDYKRWKDISQAKKQQIANRWENPGTFEKGWLDGLRCPWPEIILADPLPAKHTLWTKDLYLLYRD